MKRCQQCGLEYRDEGRTHCLVDGALLSDVVDPRVGRLVAGRFRIGDLIGSGGMANVYRGEETTTGRPIAIKVMHDGLDAAEGRERFRREARHAAAIAHENVVEVIDAGELPDGCPFIAMELLEGRPLREMLGAPLPLELVLVLSLQIAKGLARAHDLGIVHRDLKPENVFIVERGDEPLAKIVDFGIARAREDAHVTAVGAILGTPAYLAPERVRGGEAKPTTDLYALGIVMFEMLTGRLPFESESREGYLFHHLETEPTRPRALAPSCPAALESLILRLLAKSARDRPVDAHQVVRELSALLVALGARLSRVTLETTLPDWAAPTVPPSSTLGFDVWVRRALMLESIVRKAYKDAGAPEPVRRALELLKSEVVVSENLRVERAREQRKLDVIQERSRESRERLGRALHALGRDLSAARETLAGLRAELARREAEAADLDFQIASLRGKLEEVEAGVDVERAVVERTLLDTGARTERAQHTMGEATRAIVTALRALPDGAALLAELD